MNMKFLCAMFCAVALIYSAPNVYAAAATINGQVGATSAKIGTAAAQVSIGVSKGVKLTYNGTSDLYAAGAFHKSGTREFGTASRLQTIYYVQCDANDPNAPCASDYTPTAGTSTALDISGNWTSQ